MSTNQAEQDIDVASIWIGVRRALPMLLLLALIAGALTFAVLSLMAPRYQAEAQLTITAKRSNPFASKNDTNAAVPPRLDPAAINTHVRALMTPDLLLTVGNDLKLAERAEFNPAIGPVDTIDAIFRMIGLGGPRSSEPVDARVLSAMRENLTVSAARESRFLSISFKATEAELAAKVANALARTYRQSLRDIPVRETNEAVRVLEPKIEKLQREVFEAEAIAKRFRAESDQLTGGATSQTLEQQRLNTLSGEVVRAEAEQARAEARLAAAEELAVRGRGDQLPEVQSSRVIQDLIGQRVRVERQVNEARAVLLPAHPRMRQLNADLAGVRRAIRGEVATIINGISKEVRLAQLRAGQLRDQIAKLKRQLAEKSGDAARLRELEATAKSKRDELERLQKQLEDNRTVVDTNRVPVEANIVSLARPNGQPVFPKKGPFTILAIAATLMLGTALVIARELMATGLAAATPGQPSPPHHSRRKDAQSRGRKQSRTTSEAAALAQTALQVPSPSEFGIAPPSAISDLAQRYRNAAPHAGGHRLLVAGATDAIDASDEAIELAGELSEAGARVLLIDWSLDGRQLFTDVANTGEASVFDLMNETAEFEDVLAPLPDTNVHYAIASRQPVPLSELHEQKINLVLDALDEAYDHIIIVGRREDARVLFETIEGRFDAGLTVADNTCDNHPGRFLGCDVTDIDITTFARINVRGESVRRPERNPQRT